MRRQLFGAVVLLVASLCAVVAAKEPQAGVALHALFDAEWERGLREDPLAASFHGDHRYAAQLPDLSPAALAASKAADRAALAALQRIERVRLNAADQLSYDVFEWQLRQRIAGHRFRVAGQEFKRELVPLNQRGGIQTFDEVLEAVPLRTAADYRHWLARLRAFGTYTDQTIALMREGIQSGVMPPKVVMQRIPAQIALQRAEHAEASRFWPAFAQMPDTITQAERAALRAEAKQVINAVVLPAFDRLHTFFVDTYLPACSDSIGVSAQPDGPALYAYLARAFTTTELSPDEIHAIGLREVERIRAEMEKIRVEVGFQGDLAAFFEHLRTDPRYFYATPEALLEGYRALSKRIDPELVKVIGTLPRLPYGVRPIPDNLAPDTTTAYYQSGAADGTRPGFYYVNLHKPETRPRWEMLALSLHEAVPGHHLQFAVGVELPAQPLFRRTAYVVAYSEGWALYAERLGYDMGLYADPYDRFGQLTYDMWRAVRLVVDTGLHAKGWTREQAIAYFKANAPKTEQDIVNEIDRYIVWPGQALAYKIGQLKFSELRDRASSRLGERFDLRAFHDVVLATGSVPLAVLERRVDAWIAGQLAGRH